MFEDETHKLLQNILYKYVYVSDISAEFGAANWGTGNSDLVEGPHEDKWGGYSYLCSPIHPWKERLLSII